MIFDRRKLLRIGGALGLGSALAGCEQVGQSKIGSDALSFQNWLTYRIQRLLFPADALAQEFPESAISKTFRANGTTNPPDPDYQALAKNKFVDWRLRVGGLVRRPLSLSLADIRALPSRTQITRHDCVEGWSCIGKWKGALLAHVLDEAQVDDRARFAVFYCADSMDENSIVSTDEAQNPSDDANAAGAGQDADDDALPDTHYYSSIDLVAARHPQTLLAYEMNDAPLTIPYGAPLRLRNERQLGYKMPKYLMRIELVDDLRGIRGGKGGYWEDLGYDWFAGI